MAQVEGSGIAATWVLSRPSQRQDKSAISFLAFLPISKELTGALRGTLVLAPESASARIKEVHALIKAGCLKAVRVGFRSLESMPRLNGGRHYLKQELIECSLVATPALPSALLEAKRLGVSNETIKKVFKASNNATIGERIKQARTAVKHYNAQERAAIHRRAKELIASSQPAKPLLVKPKAQAKLLPAKLPPLLSPQQKAKIEQDRYNAEVHRRAKIRVKEWEKEKGRAKVSGISSAKRATQDRDRVLRRLARTEISISRLRWVKR